MPFIVAPNNIGWVGVPNSLRLNTKELAMVSVTLHIPVVDPAGVRFDDEHHAEFLEYVCGVFLNPRFESSRVRWELHFEVEGGVVSRGGDLRGLIHLAKAHYRNAVVRVNYLGASESF